MSDPEVTPPEDAPKTVALVLDDYVFDIPATPGQMHPKVLRAFERGKTTDAIEGVLGTEAYERLMADPAMSVDQLSGIMERVAEIWGFESAGE